MKFLMHNSDARWTKEVGKNVEDDAGKQSHMQVALQSLHLQFRRAQNGKLLGQIKYMIIG